MSTAGRRVHSPYAAIVIGVVFVLVGMNYLLKNLGVFRDSAMTSSGRSC